MALEGGGGAGRRTRNGEQTANALQLCAAADRAWREGGSKINWPQQQQLKTKRGRKQNKTRAGACETTCCRSVVEMQRGMGCKAQLIGPRQSGLSLREWEAQMHSGERRYKGIVESGTVAVGRSHNAERNVVLSTIWLVHNFIYETPTHSQLTTTHSINKNSS